MGTPSRKEKETKQRNSNLPTTSQQICMRRRGRGTAAKWETTSTSLSWPTNKKHCHIRIAKLYWKPTVALTVVRPETVLLTKKKKESDNKTLFRITESRRKHQSPSCCHTATKLSDESINLGLSHQSVYSLACVSRDRQWPKHFQIGRLIHSDCQLWHIKSREI